MRSKSFKVVAAVIAIAAVVSVVMTVYRYSDIFAPKPADPLSLGYVQMEAEITRVLSSGRGTNLTTLLTVQYEYAGEEHTGTLRLSGYVEGRYNKGDTVACWFNPETSEMMIGDN